MLLHVITRRNLTLHHLCLNVVHHHHHHHVQEGLGLIPVPCILKMKLVPPNVVILRNKYLKLGMAAY